MVWAHLGRAQYGWRSDEGEMKNKRFSVWSAAGTTVLAIFCFTFASSSGASTQARPLKSAPSSGYIAIDSRVTICEPAGTPLPIQNSVKDLANDFEKVFGVAPKIVARQEDAGPQTILVGEVARIPEAMRPVGLLAPESFAISVTNRASKTVVLTGPDLRGAIYAVYEFSREYLGVDPMYYWTDREPARRTSIRISASLSQSYPAPAFKYRGLFLNDEDLLTGWAPGEKKDRTGISLAVWNKVYETILRLKGNIVVPGTWIFPDDPQIKLAGDRGLIVTQHHAIPLGLNVARWPRDIPYNYTTHPEILERAWKDAVASYDPNQEILWSVGLRGLSDVSYASMDPTVDGNDKALGALISKAIADQMQIVRAVHPDAKFVTDFWQEGARLVHQGYLTIPPEVIPVWADTGYGNPQDAGQVSAGQGLYYHVAMMNGRANQLTEMVPVERISAEIGRYAKARATEYILLNTSDIRPVSMTTKAVMDIAWKGSLTGGSAASDDYYRAWAKDEFGARAADAVADVYKDYFRAPAHWGDPPLEYGDQLYHTEARQMMLTYMTDAPLYTIPSQAPYWEPPRFLGPAFGRGVGKDWLNQTVKVELEQCGDAQPRWDAVWKKAVAAESLVDPARLPFYRAQVLAMIAINRDSNRILLLVVQAIQDLQEGDSAKAHAAVGMALTQFDDIHQAEAAAEYGKWKNWYRGDWLTGIDRTQETVKSFSRFLDDPLTHLEPPLIWSYWEAYYHIMHYEGDRSADVQ
jgi:hypothetical protein